MHLVRQPIRSPNETLRRVPLQVERLTLAKRRWRGTAEDGLEFGFELEAPLRHGDTVFQTEAARYLIEQQTEPVIEIALDVPASAAAGIGWAIGNLHLELSSEPTRLLAPDEPAIRRLLERLNVPFHPTRAIFRPGHFVRGAQTNHELGPSHRH